MIVELDDNILQDLEDFRHYFTVDSFARSVAVGLLDLVDKQRRKDETNA